MLYMVPLRIPLYFAMYHVLHDYQENVNTHCLVFTENPLLSIYVAPCDISQKLTIHSIADSACRQPFKLSI